MAANKRWNRVFGENATKRPMQVICCFKNDDILKKQMNLNQFMYRGVLLLVYFLITKPKIACTIRFFVTKYATAKTGHIFELPLSACNGKNLKFTRIL